MAGPTVTWQARADTKPLERGLARSEKKVDDLKRKLREAGRVGKASGGKVEQAFGKGVTKAFVMVAGASGVGLLAVALRGIVRLAGEVKQEIVGIMGELKAGEDTLKTLWQVSESHAAYKGMSGRQRLLMAKEGMTRVETGSLQFALKSLEALEGVEAVAKTKRFMDPAVAAEFYGRVTSPAAWGKAWAPENVLSALARGAEKSAFTTSQTAGWFPRTIAGMKQLGAHPAEVLGVGAAISPLTANPEMLATQLDRLAAVMDKEGYGGAGILTGLRHWQLQDPESYEVAKQANIRFKRAILAIEGEAKGEARKAGYATAWEAAEAFTKMTAAEFIDPVAYRAKIATPPELSDLAQSRVAKAQADIAMEPLAEQQMALRTIIDRSKALAAFTGKSLIATKVKEKWFEAGATIGMVGKATEVARERYLANVIEYDRDLYMTHAAAQLPIDFKRKWHSGLAHRREGSPLRYLWDDKQYDPFSGKFVPFEDTRDVPGYAAPYHHVAVREPFVDLPRDPSRGQLDAIARLADAIADLVIRERFGMPKADTKEAVRDGVREGMGNRTLGNPDQEPP